MSRGGAVVRQTGVPILMYHQVSAHCPEGYRKYVVTPDAFARQMHWLRAMGFTAVTMDALRAARTGGPGVPRRAVVITFDDGYRDALRHAREVLGSLRWPATCYLVAGLVGRTSAWLTERGLSLPLAGWAEVRVLSTFGFEIGAHSLTHRRLAEVDEAACRHELQASRAVLEAALGQPVVHLAYPYGSTSAEVRRLAASAGYETACSVEPGVSDPAEDLLALRRVPITGYDSLADFACRLHTGRTMRELVGGAVHRVAPGRVAGDV